MGKRGRPKTPTPILKMRGSGLVAGRKNEPHPKPSRPTLPDGLSADVVEAWEQVCPLLESIGVLTALDGNALVRYCTIYARWWKSNQFLQTHGETYPVYAMTRDGVIVPDADGRPVIKHTAKWPEVLICRDLANQLLRLEQEFGLTPSARAGLSVAPVSDHKDLVTFADLA